MSHGTVFDVLLAGALLSAVSSGLVLLTYARSPALRRHPASLIACRSLCDLVFSLQLVATYSVAAAPGVDVSAQCYYLSSMTQFFVLATEMYFLWVALDLRASITDPFADFKARTRWYHAGTLLVCGATAAAVHAGRYYGDGNVLGICWMARSARLHLNYPMWALFYAPMAAIYLIALSTYAYAHRRLGYGLPSSYASRRRVLEETRAYTLAYTLYWTVAAALYCPMFLDGDRVQQPLPLVVALAAILAGRGCVTLAIWTRNSPGLVLASLSCTRGAREHRILSTSAAAAGDEHLEPLANVVLRREIVHFASRGIAETVDFATRHAPIALAATQSGDGPPSQPGGAAGAWSPRAGGDSPAASPHSDITRHVTVRHVNTRWAPALHGLAGAAAGVWTNSPLSRSLSASNPSAGAAVAATAQGRSTGSERQLRSQSSEVLGRRSSSFRSLRAAEREASAPGAWKRLARVRLRFYQVEDEEEEGEKDEEEGGETGEVKAEEEKGVERGDTPGVWRRPAGQHVFDFVDYEPQLFAHARHLAGVKDEDFVSVLASASRDRLSKGRSGAFMFFSGDRRFVVKTASKGEVDTLLRILPALIRHLARHPTSLINRILGCYALTLYGHTMRLIVVENLLRHMPEGEVRERYDLKGSWVNRNQAITRQPLRVSARIPLARGRAPETVASRFDAKRRKGGMLKDNDLNYVLPLGPQRAEAVRTALRRDAVFLASCGIMDYSLLVGVHRARSAVPPQRPIATGAAPGVVTAAYVEGPVEFHLGVIDVLQTWTMGKRVERAFKVLMRCLDRDGISAVNPATYQRRFCERVVDGIIDGAVGDGGVARPAPPTPGAGAGQS